MYYPNKSIRWGAIASALLTSTGCLHSGWRHGGQAGCESCPAEYQQAGCPACEVSGDCQPCGVAPCGGHCAGCLAKIDHALFGWACRKSNAIPETLPLGSTVRAHVQTMETNAEAADFIIHQNDFVGQTAALTPYGKDHILEIAARMRSTPFPVVIERSENNADPELDALRRNLVAQILCDLGNVDAQQRTVVGTAYGPGYTGQRSEQMYYQHIYRGGGLLGNTYNGGAVGFGSGYGGGFF